MSKKKLTKEAGIIKLPTRGRLKKILEQKPHNKNANNKVKISSVKKHGESKKDSLMVSVSGIRGIIGESLTPDIITQYTAAFATWTNGGTIIVGRDSRVSGEMVKALVHGSLTACGCKVIDIGIASTPTVEIAVKHLGARGGVAITASHNPIQWNALKLIGPEGKFLSSDHLEEYLDIFRFGKIEWASWDRLGKVTFYDHAITDHITKILSLPYLNPEALRSRRFKVVVDCVNGAGGLIVPRLLTELGCEVITLNEEPHGIFPRNPEPTIENLKLLGEAVVKHGADIGFAVDPDVDRLALVSEKGIPIGEEWTLAIATELVLSKRKGPVVVNASTTMAIDDICRKYQVECFRTKIGEINVSTKMEELNAVIGGEGNGGVILPETHLGRDASTGVALILQFLHDSGKPFSESIRSIPAYIMKKDKIELQDIDADKVLTQIKSDNKKLKTDTIDGLKFIKEDSWIHFRKSNTEPILRIIAEAKTQKELDELIKSFTSYFH